MVLLDILIYPITFIVFVIIIKVGLKKRCGGKTLIAGFLIFFFLSLFTITITDGIINPPLDISWRYIEFSLGGGIIGLMAFAILYMIGKPIYEIITKNNSKPEKKDNSGELKEPF